LTSAAPTATINPDLLIQADNWIKENTKADIAYMNSLSGTVNPAIANIVKKELARTEPSAANTVRKTDLCGVNQTYWYGMTDPNQICQDAKTLAFADFTNGNDGTMYFQN
jgi:hypothetical protein